MNIKKILVVTQGIEKVFLGKPMGGLEYRSYLLFKDYNNVNFLSTGYNSTNVKVISSKNKILGFFNDFKILNYDAVCFFSFSRKTVFQILLAKMFNKKIIYFVCSNGEVGLNLNYVNSYYKWVPKVIFPFVDLFITQTDVQRKEIQKKYKKECQVIPNPVVINNNTKYKNNHFILWVGRNHPIKGTDILCETVSQLTNIKFKLIGINKLDIKVNSKNAEVLGRINIPEMDEYYNSATILINTSYSEGYPNSFLQSLANKTPIISYSANPDNFLERSGGGYSARGNKAEFISKIRELYDNEAELKRMSQSG